MTLGPLAALCFLGATLLAGAAILWLLVYPSVKA